MHSASPADPAPPHVEDGREKRDVNVRAIALLGAAILGGTTLALAIAGALFSLLASREAREQPPPSPLVGQGAALAEPPEPRLQTTPVADLVRLRAAEEAALASYGWVDRERGTVRIPIERAIDLLAETGLPETTGAGRPGDAAGSDKRGGVTPGAVQDVPHDNRSSAQPKRTGSRRGR